MRLESVFLSVRPMVLSLARSTICSSTTLRIKRAIHQRYGLEQQCKQDDARLRYVEQNPDAANGGRRNADAELQWLRNICGTMKL
jgi:hypothetical protein